MGEEKYKTLPKGLLRKNVPSHKRYLNNSQIIYSFFQKASTAVNAITASPPASNGTLSDEKLFFTRHTRHHNVDGFVFGHEKCTNEKKMLL